MKENKYDNEEFFEKYSQMSRSKEGLIAAGEWDTLKKLLPEFQDKKMLDLGCGYGWHCIYAMEQGAKSVVGIDISRKMLEIAKEKTTYKEVEYICSAMEDIEFENDSFEIVLSSLALHYIQEYESIVQKVYRCLKTGGSFVFSVEHPVFTAQGLQDWDYDEAGNIRNFPVDNYYYEGKRAARFLGEEVTKFHRSLTTYLNTLLQNSFEIQQIIEPQPSKHLIETVPGMQDEMRRPMMLIISAIKK